MGYTCNVSWLVVWNIFFHILGRKIPFDFHIFQRGRYTANQYIYIYFPTFSYDSPLFLGDIPQGIHDDQLGTDGKHFPRYFQHFGRVVSCNVLKDKRTKKTWLVWNFYGMLEVYPRVKEQSAMENHHLCQR